MSTDSLPRPLIGWPLFAVPDADGRLDWPDLEASVRQGIRVILSTRPGEQLMRPEFGAGLDRLLHEPNNLATRRQIRDWIMESLGRWERRIVLDRVEVLELPDQPVAFDANRIDLLALDEALQKLEAEQPDKARLVKLRYFAGCSLEESAKMLGLSRATAQRHWAYARAWLFGQLNTH